VPDDRLGAGALLGGGSALTERSRRLPFVLDDRHLPGDSGLVGAVGLG
jgi:hypothetical protein